jgi:hypothetical protein
MVITSNSYKLSQKIQFENADVVKEFVFRYLNVISINLTVHIFIQSRMHNAIKNPSS